MSEGVVGSLRAGLSTDSPRVSVSAARDRIAAARHFLFISAPFGPFARELARHLEAYGATCTRVLVNGGDALDWGASNSAPYFGDERGWCDWLQSLIERGGVTDLVTYGDSSPYCTCSSRGISGPIGSRSSAAGSTPTRGCRGTPIGTAATAPATCVRTP
jgi:hypothetical protein